jgi:hypothetical protein
MNKHSLRERKKLTVFLSLAAGILCLAMLAIAQEGAAVYQSPVASLVRLGFKFEGAKTCAAAECHGGTQEKPGKGLDSYTKWSGKDPHNKSFETLGNDASKKIAAGLSIPDATASDRCLGCHSVNAPANLQGAKFSLAEGNSCNSCHGPSEKWREPHAKEGWTNAQRKELGTHEALLTKWGLYDTKPLVYRAERCTSCHLAIEPDMIKAGHPQPIFELDYFSNPQVYEDRHWRDPDEKYFGAKQWAAGQVVSTRDAMKQLATRASGTADNEAIKSAYDQAMGHLTVFKDLVSASGISAGDVVAQGENLKKAMAAGDKAQIAAAAKAISDAAAKSLDAVASYQPDKASDVKIMDAIAGEAMAKDFGLHGVEQQAYGIYSLYNAYAKAESPADAQAVNDTIAKLFDSLDKKAVSPDYDKTLADVTGKLPK